MRLLVLLALVGLAGWLLHALLFAPDGPTTDLPAFEDEPSAASGPDGPVRSTTVRAPRGGAGPRHPDAETWSTLPLAGPAHGLPPALDLHEIEVSSEAMWHPTGAWLLERLATHFPDLGVAFRDAEVLKDFQAKRWPQPFPGRMHLGMLVTSLPDIGYRAVHHRDTLYVLTIEDAERLRAEASDAAE